MNHLKHFAAMLVIAALTSGVDASDGIHFGGNGFRLDMVPNDPDATSGTQVATATCEVKSSKGAVVLHWATSPFVHTALPEMQSDAFIAATVTRFVGKATVSPQRTIDRTDIAKGNDSAAVAMGIQGNARLSIQLEVGLENENAVAGKHCTTVVLTVTGN
jgi:hypothetical protein